MPSTNTETLEAAKIALQAGKRDQAISLLEQATHQDTADHRPWLMLAGLASTKADALDYLARAETLEPHDPTLQRARDWVNRKFRNEHPTAPATSFSTVFTQRDGIWTVLGAISLVSLVFFAAWLSWLNPLRWVLGLAFVLFLPGYWLVNALFPGREDIDGIERVGLSLGLSVAWVSILALILDSLPWGLRLWPILGGELASITLFMSVALFRRLRLPVGDAFLPPPLQPRAWWNSLSPADRRIYKIIAGVLALALLAVAWVFLVPSPAEFMTEFYILGPEGLAENYPREPAVGEPLSVTLGLTNLERADYNYRVEVWAVDPWESGRRQLVGQIQPFTLPVGGTFEYPITWSMPWVGDDQQVEFLLFMDDQTEPYRQLRLWLDVIPGHG